MHRNVHMCTQTCICARTYSYVHRNTETQGHTGMRAHTDARAPTHTHVHTRVSREQGHTPRPGAARPPARTHAQPPAGPPHSPHMASGSTAGPARAPLRSALRCSAPRGRGRGSGRRRHCACAGPGRSLGAALPAWPEPARLAGTWQPNVSMRARMRRGPAPGWQGFCCSSSRRGSGTALAPVGCKVCSFLSQSGLEDGHAPTSTEEHSWIHLPYDSLSKSSKINVLLLVLSQPDEKVEQDILYAGRIECILPT